MQFNIQEIRENHADLFVTLEEKKRAGFLKELEIVTLDIIKQDSEYSKWVNILGEDKTEIAKNAIYDHIFSEVADCSPDFRILLEQTSKKTALYRAILQDYLTKNDLGFKEYEKLVILSFMELASTVDNIYFDWRDKVICSEVGQKILSLDKEENGKGSAWLDELGLTNQYAIVEENENKELVQIPYAQAFEKDFITLETELNRLVQKLTELLPTSDEKVSIEINSHIVYFKALIESLMCKDVDNLDKLWEQTDILWVGIKGEILPMHFFEYGYMDPARRRVVPELRVLTQDDDNKYVNDGVEESREALLKYLPDICKDRKLLKQSLWNIKQVNLKIYATIITSGYPLHFKFVGQSLPNRDNVRIEVGTRISCDLSSMKHRQEKALELAKKLITDKDSIDKLISLDYKENLIINVAGHEMAHPAFMNIGTEKALGESIIPLIEEAKATYTILVTAPDIAKEKGDYDLMTRVALFEFLSSMRCISARNEPHIKPYYYMDVYILNDMLDSGFFYKDEQKGWALDFSKSPDLFVKFKETYTKLIDIYDNLDTSGIPEFINKGDNSREEIEEIYKIITK